jgi:PcfJ-like protein
MSGSPVDEARTVRRGPLSEIGSPRGVNRKAGHPIATSTRTRRRRRSPWDHDAAKVAEAERRLRESERWLRDPEGLLRKLEAGEVIQVPLLSEAALFVHAVGELKRSEVAVAPLAPDAESLRRLLLFCRRRTALAHGRGAQRFANALVALSARRSAWIRPPEDWRAPTHNADRQFQSLLRHLLATYEVPPFLEAAWFEGLSPEGIQHQDWYLHVARGKNIRTAEGLPVPLTRMQAHHYLHAPDDLGIVAAFRWAKVIDLGGDDRLARAVLATRIGSTFGDEVFWDSVVRWFIAHPALDPSHYGPIIDYLRRQKLGDPDRGSPADQPPESPRQPNLCMKGRTPETMLRAVREWHRELAQATRTVVPSWGPSGIAGFAHHEDNGEERRVYEIAELLSTAELRDEGSAMQHCVASYASECASGRTSIWSLTLRLGTGRTIRLATIELRNRDRTIVQVRRRCNKLPTEREFMILARWEDSGGPERSQWLVPR